MGNPTAAIVVIGNEILSGRTDDANVAYIARRLNDIGIDVREVRMVRDDSGEIGNAVLALSAQYDYVFTTGGIGPTHDDITISSLAKALGQRVVRDPVVEERLRQYYGNRLVPAALRMADFPEGARVIHHGEGWAPGCMVENVVVLAGSPTHMQVMLEAVLPLLRQGSPVHTKTVDAWIPENQVAEGLGQVQARFTEVEIGSYPYRSEIDGELKLGTAVVMRGTNGKSVEEAFAAVEKMLMDMGAVIRAAA